MPINWIKRILEASLTGPSAALRLFPVWLILGPRQVGKSSLLLHCAEKGRLRIDLDDLETRARANQDPQLFARELRPPLFIDEIQYAPQLLSQIKRLADAGAAPGSVWLTGSQSFEVMRGVSETLAGRVAILNLFGLSDEEKKQSLDGPRAYFESILGSTFPKLHGVTDPAARQLYLSSYLQTYVERDVRELLGIEKRREFETFVRACALRTGQVINYDDLGRDCGVSAVTAKQWVSLLEDSYLVRLVPPYHSNRTKRLIKSPKLYFLDMGLAAHLAGWREAEMLRLGPMAGAAFETHVLGQIERHFRHRALDAQVYFWRTRDGAEIDFLVETAGHVYPIEVKLGSVDPRALPKLGPLAEPHWKRGRVLTLLHLGRPSPVELGDEWEASGPESLPFGG